MGESVGEAVGEDEFPGEGDLRLAAEREVVETWRALSAGRAHPSAGVEQDDGLFLFATGLPAAFFNGAFVTGATPPGDVMERVRAFFAPRRRPYLLRVPLGRDDLAEAALASGLRPVQPLELMALPIPPVRPDPVPGLAVREVDTPDALAVHVALLAAAFEMPVDLMAGFLEDLPLRDTRLRAFNGFLDGRPVTASAVFVHEAVAGVYDVATLADHRGRGLAQAMTWHAVDAGAAHGARVATLQPSPMGRPVYDRMGFRVVATWRQFEDRRAVTPPA